MKFYEKEIIFGRGITLTCLFLTSYLTMLNKSFELFCINLTIWFFLSIMSFLVDKDMLKNKDFWIEFEKTINDVGGLDV